MRTNMATWMIRIPLALAIALGAIGCARGPASKQESTARTTPQADSTVAKNALVDKATPTTSVRKSRLPQGDKPAVAPAAEKYVGPFPHRTNPFALPNTESAATAAKQRETVKQAEERLLGFINVDGRKALLQVDGKIWAAQKGDTRDGIEVVDVTPADVTLRRDGATWQLTLMPPSRNG